MLTVNTTIKELTIEPSYGNKLDQLAVLQIIKKIHQNFTLELLVLEVTHEAEYDDKLIRDVEMLTEQYINNRQSHGVTTPLQVEL